MTQTGRQVVGLDFGTTNSALAYIDTSALLRIVLRESGALDELRTYDRLVSSELIVVESARTIDRLRLQGSLTTEEAAGRLRAVNEWLEAFDLVLLRPPVLSRASEPLALPLGTLDALHLADGMHADPAQVDLGQRAGSLGEWQVAAPRHEGLAFPPLGALRAHCPRDSQPWIRARYLGALARGCWRYSRTLKVSELLRGPQKS